MRPFLALVLRDLRQHATDKAVVLFAVVIPLTLSAVFMVAFSGVTGAATQASTVAVSVPDGDAAGEALAGALEGLAGEDGLRLTVRRADADQVAGLVGSGDADVGVVVPPGFQDDLAAGRGPTVQVTRGEDAGLSGQVVVGVLDGALARLDGDAAAVAAAAGSGLDGSATAALTQRLAELDPQVPVRTGQVPGEQLALGAGIVAGQAGMFLFFTVGFAVLTLLTEREWGTLARLRTMPLPTWMVPVAKGVVGVVLGVVSTTVLLGSGQLLFPDVDLGDWGAVMVLVVATVTAATSVMALILRVARTSEQASLAMSVVAISLGVSGGTFFRVPTEGWVGQLVQVNPVAALGRGLGITSGGGGVADLGPVLLTLALFTVAVLTLARVLPARREAL